jgi:hypothetical protein
MLVSRRRRNRRCAKASISRLNRASLYAEASVMHPDAIATDFGTEAMLRLWRIAIFRTGFPSGWIDGDVFSWKAGARLA